MSKILKNILNINIIFVIFVFMIFFGFTKNSNAYNDQTRVVTGNYNSYLYFIQRVVNTEIWASVQINGYVSVNHRVGMTSGGSIVDIGTPINFAYNPDDPFFLNGGFSYWDTPYGEWRNDVNEAVSSATLTSRGQLIYDGSNFPGYIYWIASRPSVYMTSTNPAVVSCSGMSCWAVGSGVAQVRANIDGTMARAKMNIYTNRFGWLSDQNIRYFSGNKTTDSAINMLPATSMVWAIAVTSPVTNGACGNARGDYIPASTTWRSPACARGTPDNDIITTPFLNPGETKTWNCIGSGTGHTNDFCTATRKLPIPDVVINPPVTNISLNNNSVAVSSKIVNLNWRINNAAQACGSGIGCTCIASGSWSGGKTYPNNQSVTVGTPGVNNFTLTCTNPTGDSNNDTAVVNAGCDIFADAGVCNQPCGDGNLIRTTVDSACNIGSATMGTCNLGNCPVSTEFQEIRP